MKLNELESEKLLEATKVLVSEERRLSIEVLLHLQEIERRRLYSERGFPGLWEFAVKYLGYSEGAAHRRIAAMRLMKTTPAIAAKLADGSLTLSVAARVQSFVTKESADPLVVLAAVAGKSFRETEIALLEIAPQALPKETSRPVSPTHTEIKFMVDGPLKQKLDSLVGRSNGRNYGEFLRRMILAEWKKIMDCREATTTSKVNDLAQNLPEKLKKLVWLRDRGRCTYLDITSGRICGAENFLQVDHIVPRAKGGSHSMENLRLLCREHNLLAASKSFGREKMEAFRKS